MLREREKQRRLFLADWKRMALQSIKGRIRIMPIHDQFDFNQKPFLVIWETTRACDLACVHCRACAQPLPAPDELTTEQGKMLLRQIQEAGAPLVVFSGGDALKRPDIFELIREAKRLRLRAAAIPAVTPALTPEVFKEFKAAGLDQLAFSLDDADPVVHDQFRRTPGVFDRTLEAVRLAREAGLGVQINSLVNVHNQDRLEPLMRLMEGLDIVFWEVFFLVPMGRGKDVEVMTPELFDAAFKKIYAFGKRVPFIIKVTEAPHYRRYFLEQEEKQEARKVALLGSSAHGKKNVRQQAGRVNSGKGFAFVSYRGDVYPSGFLPIATGNILQTPIGEIYRNHPVFRELRNESLLKGRCGLCEYRETCGGSRARAYALTGDYLAEDPTCAYQPACVLKT